MNRPLVPLHVYTTAYHPYVSSPVELVHEQLKSAIRTSRLIDVGIIHKHLGIQVDCKEQSNQPIDATINTKMAVQHLQSKVESNDPQPPTTSIAGSGFADTNPPTPQPSPDSNIISMSSGRFIVISSDPKVAVFPPGSQIHLGDLRNHSFYTSENKSVRNVSGPYVFSTPTYDVEDNALRDRIVQVDGALLYRILIVDKITQNDLTNLIKLLISSEYCKPK
ncbi:unnamed protein product [Rodentolepis nana]|uniref:DNA-directed RNA polymerase n=1 Tax=Rodentolepis nana TaxID=102285 RepID=A0A0R3TE27_RODNA|nr:unnamed protein product [Rodentolepis nana]